MDTRTLVNKLHFAAAYIHSSHFILFCFSSYPFSSILWAVMREIPMSGLTLLNGQLFCYFAISQSRFLFLCAVAQNISLFMRMRIGVCVSTCVE